MVFEIRERDGKGRGAGPGGQALGVHPEACGLG